MRTFLIILVTLFSTGAWGKAGITLAIATHKDGLLVYIFNNSDKQVVVNKRFAEGRDFHPTELVMTFEDTEGTAHSYPALQKIGGAEKEDYVTPHAK